MIRIYKQRDYQLRKVKVIESIFCRIRCEFSKFNTPQPTPSSSTSLSGIYKKYTCFPKISINSCSTRPQFYFNLVTAWQEFVFWLDSQFVTPIIRYLRNTLLPEIVAPFHQKSSEHLTTRNCCSFRQKSSEHLTTKLLLHIIKYCCIIVCYFISINII